MVTTSLFGACQLTTKGTSRVVFSGGNEVNSSAVVCADAMAAKSGALSMTFLRRAMFDRAEL